MKPTQLKYLAHLAHRIPHHRCGTHHIIVGPTICGGVFAYVLA